MCCSVLETIFPIPVFKNSYLCLARTISAFLPSTAPSPYCGIGASTESNKNTSPGESKRPSAVTARGPFSWLKARYCTWVSFRVSPLNHWGFWLDVVAKIATGQEHTGLSRSKQQHLVAVVQEIHIQSMRETNLEPWTLNLEELYSSQMILLSFVVAAVVF